jgi:uncharacterized protein (DUF885 family)
MDEPALRLARFDGGWSDGHLTSMTCHISRRETLVGLVAMSAAAGADGVVRAGDAATLLDRLSWGLLELGPERATSLGVDTGAHANLRRTLEDRSPEGVAARRRFLTNALADLARLPRTGLDPAVLTSLAVTESAFRTALDGMALPYGVATIGDWRNTPYAVIQNVGSWLDVPQMLDGDQPVRDAADAEAYLVRLAGTSQQLDGETARIRFARERGLVPPSFLLDKTIAGMTQTITNAAKVDAPFVGPLAHKAATIPGDWTARATRIVTSAIVPALQRQLAELRAERAIATDAAGMATRPHGPEWYAWGLRAGTTHSAERRRSPCRRSREAV